MMLRPIRRALLSVSDKSGLVELARLLHERFKVELIATGGTKQSIADAGLPVRDVSALTQFPEILDGRVKTLHPAIYAGVLAKRDKAEHLATLAEHNLPEIDLVVCNLYPFEQTIAWPDVSEAQAIENIDIGGPCMVRASAKNFDAVTVLTHPDQYAAFVSELAAQGGSTRRCFRHWLATLAFEQIARYDLAIAGYFREQAPPQYSYPTDQLRLTFKESQKLRYGENPHQSASFYIEPGVRRACVATAQQLHGKELSYNNILDLDSALNLAREFSEPAAVVVKHNNPCGAATGPTLADAFVHAWEGDPQSAFGGILAFNRVIDAATATALMTGERFVECIIAPDYAPEALQALQGWKKNVRLLKTGPLEEPASTSMDYRRVDGGLLVQSRDVGADDSSTWKVATDREPTPEQRHALAFAWTVCKHVKSNAIVLAQPSPTGGSMIVGVGAGQMSRVDSTQIAIRKAGKRVKGSVLASDAFFPFRDNVDAAASDGVAAIVQPGGSQRDAESIAACNEHGLTMLFTGLRHFRH